MGTVHCSILSLLDGCVMELHLVGKQNTVSPLQVVASANPQACPDMSPVTFFFCREKWPTKLHSGHGSRDHLWQISGMLNDCMTVLSTLDPKKGAHIEAW